ncbi:MAG: ferritin-like domain-containing protein [Acidobacteriota bacterium]|nr:ferritin-like domain-containing protein [Acidobacteriota bacterium]
MNIDTLEEFSLKSLREMYDAENQLTKALPKMAKASKSDELRSAFEDHLEQTKNHVTRLEQIFSSMGKKPDGETCGAMKALVKEGEEIISEMDQSPLRDAALISAGNKVEHFEIACYGTARTFAQQMGKQSAVTLLEKTLEEEKMADEKLTRLAETVVNTKAQQLGAKG